LKQQKSDGKKSRRKRRKWKVKEVIVRFVPFESEAQRDEVYRLWVKSLLRGAKEVSRANQFKQQKEN